MKTINKVLILLVTIGVAAIAAFALSAPAVQNSDQIKIDDTVQLGVTSITEPVILQKNPGQISYKGHVQVSILRADTGVREIVADKDNLITNGGLAFISRKLNAQDVNASNRTLAISLADIGTVPLATWSILSGEKTTLGFTRNTTGLYTSTATGQYTVNATWVALGTMNNINTTGLHWNNASNSDGNLFAALQFSNQSLLINDILQCNWSIIIS